MKKDNRTFWVDYLRSFITALVVAHHSSLAYTTFASFDNSKYVNSTHPVVDNFRWIGLDIFEDFNDIFFMSLMFLISGIFVTRGLGKGAAIFLKGRFYRLFIPFLIGVCILMPVAYYPAYLISHGPSDLKTFLIDFLTVEFWPAGPPWFIWVLFAFNIIFAFLYPISRNWITRLAVRFNELKDHPIKVLLVFYSLTWLLYVPMMLSFGPGKWTGIGPFDFQVSRVFLYFGYFVIGIIIGKIPINDGLFADRSTFIKKPFHWLIVAILAYVLVKLAEQPLEHLISTETITPLMATVIYRSIWTFSCSTSCLAFLILFKRLFRSPLIIWQSLSNNAYGIYLIHFIFVIWCQYLLLGVTIPAFYKFIITFFAALSLSWLTTYLIRKIKIFGEYL